MAQVITMEGNLYDMVTENPSKGEVLFAIGLEETAIARFRDIDVPPYKRFRQIPLFTDSRFKHENTTKDTVIVLARVGGGNREDYKVWWDTIRSHPNYITDYDTDFDKTYAFIEFRCNKDVLENLKKLDNNPDVDVQRIIEVNKRVSKDMLKAIGQPIDESVIVLHAIELAYDLLKDK